MSRHKSLKTERVNTQDVLTLAPNSYLSYFNSKSCNSKRLRLVVRRDGVTYYRVSLINMRDIEEFWCGHKTMVDAIAAYNSMSV